MFRLSTPLQRVFFVCIVCVTSHAWADPHADGEAFIRELLAKMTLDEKIGQLNQHAGFSDPTGPVGDDAYDQVKLSNIRSGRVGSMLNVIGAEVIREVQKTAVEQSRLGIPLIFAHDVVHGYRTIFPIPLAESSSWDPQLAAQSAGVAAKEAAADGLSWTFAPMVDISREPRWGRVMEGAGEDPFLASDFAVARVRGFQGDDLSDPHSILATAKHFAAYGWTQAGRDYTHAEIDDVTLHNIVLPPFKAAVQEANVATLMNAFNVRNGIPATADRYLQRDLLKGQWGFDGFVVTDWGSLIEMVPHGFARDHKDAAKHAIHAGCDVEMETGAYLAHLRELVDEGQVDVGLIDDAVLRVLRLKYRLGLFDDPYRYLKSDPDEVLEHPDHKQLAREAAEKSVVLLKNQNSMLPLKRGDSLAVIGALAADKDAPLGHWRAQGRQSSAVSVLEGFDAAGIQYRYSEGAVVGTNLPALTADEQHINETDTSGFAAAVELAKQVDKVVMVLGEPALLSGEARSRANIGLPGVQLALLKAVQAVNPNIVLVVMSGRPLTLSWPDAHVPAIVQAWHLGSESGHALASVLSGKVNPSGKLTMTFPRSLGQLPIYYNRNNTGRPGPREDVWWSRYIDESSDPLYAFGHGLSYTEFAYSGLKVRSGKQVKVSVTVKNIGKHRGEEVVQLYIWDKVASVVRPIRELKGYQKLALKPGESRRLHFVLGEKELGFYNAKGEYVVEPGAFEVFVGGSSNATLTAGFDWRH